jgi:two-component system sensor histidine kinase/response regulator
MKTRTLSIAAVLITVLVTVVTLLLGLFATVAYNIEKKQREMHLKDDLSVTLDQQSVGLTLPMWELDETQINAILRAGMSNREVFAITASTANTKYTLARDATWQIAHVSEEPSADGVISDERTIRHNNETLGTVRVFVSPRFLNEDLSARQTSLVVFILVLDATLVLSLSLLLWQLMLKPVKVLKRFAGAVRDDGKVEEASGKAWFYGELQELNQSIREMTAMLDSRYRALRESEQRMNLAVRAASLGIWDWDPLSNQLLWNDECLLQYGIRKGDFKKRYDDWLNALTPESVEHATSELQAALRGEREFESEFSIRRPDGAVRIIRGNGTVVRDQSGRVIRMVGINIDITERKQAEQQIKQLNIELEQRVRERTAQLESAVADLARARDDAEAATRTKSEFLANMSHEIRTPMNAIMGLTGLTLRTELTGKQRAYLGHVKTAAESLLTIIDDILDFSKIEAGKLVMESREFALEELRDKLTSVVALKAHEKGLKFLIDVAPDVPPSLIGDMLRLGQVLINLCNNAVKFTEHGEVALIIEQEGIIAAGRVALRFTVRDTGIGMSDEQQSLLFKPFSQVDASTTRVYGGTGLGLAISRQIVTLMNGEITVQSEPGRGSEFYFTAHFGLGETALQPPASTSRLTESNARVLVIDDSAHSRAILDDLLHRLGYTSTSVNSAVAGLAALKHTDKQSAYELIILDSKLPDIDCFELVSLIRHRPGPAPRIVILTSFGDEETSRQVVHQQLDGCLRRPISLMTLRDTLRAVLDRESSAKEQPPVCRSEFHDVMSVLRGGRVLLVEDNAINQMVAKELLSDVAGMSVTLAEDGEHALQSVKAEAYDAILMDIQMPVMDGLQVTALIRQDPAYDAVPIIAMTAHAMPSDQQKCLDVGMNDYVTKPFEPQDLFSVLARWIRPHGPASSSGTATPKISDEARGVDFDLGLQHCVGRQALFDKIAQRYLSTRCQDSADIRSALNRHDTEAAATIAHQQISTAGTLGANALSEAARALQLAILAGESEQWPEALDVFERHLAAVVADLEEHFATRP